MVYPLHHPSPLDAHRPNLEPSWSGVGVVPNFAPPPPPHPASGREAAGAPASPAIAGAAATTPTPLEALTARLDALRAEALQNLRDIRKGGAMLPLAHTLLPQLNADLAEVQRLDRERRPYHRSPVAQSWSTPAITPTRLYALVDLLPALTAALRVLAATRVAAPAAPFLPCREATGEVSAKPTEVVPLAPAEPPEPPQL